MNMKNEIFSWNVYEITAQNTKVHGVMLRGRLRKLALEKGFNLLCENASDVENCVRFAVLSEANAKVVSNYLEAIINDVKIEQLNQQIQNPVLSKLKVNKQERYTI